MLFFAKIWEFVGPFTVVEIPLNEQIWHFQDVIAKERVRN
jgi:hypothetical protein